jgi:hypothetical protein
VEPHISVPSEGELFHHPAPVEFKKISSTIEIQLFYQGKRYTPGDL